MPTKAPAPPTLSGFQQELDKLFGDHGEFMAKFGELFIRARKDLNADDYETFIKYARLRGISVADINASIAIAKGDMDGRLFFAGVASSKVLNMSREDQDRLLSGEKLDVRTSEDEYESRTWFEMSPTERSRLFGIKKNGRILPWEDQPSPNGSKSNLQTIREFHKVRLNGSMLVLTEGKEAAKVLLKTFGVQLRKHGGLRDVIEALQHLESVDPDSLDEVDEE